MTAEERIIFRPSDIQRVTFECNKCGGSIAVAGGEQLHQEDGYALRCPSCDKQWPKTAPSDVYRGFLAVLSDLIKAQAEQDAFTVRLELRVPDSPSGPA